jgi:sugar O-acyltransferase (sialic acid O-acetyltransferase NeuD family)
MAERSFLVYGAGGHGKVVADAGRAAGLVLAAFIDDDEELAGREIFGRPVIATSRFEAERDRWLRTEVVLGIGGNRARADAAGRLEREGFSIATVIHPAAVIAPSASIGRGTVVMAGVVVNPDAVVEVGAILNTGCVVEHDCVVGAFAHLSPNAALGGGVVIGQRSHLGLGAVALPLVRIGADVRVGAGAVVIRDVADGLTVVGAPARPVRPSGA